MELFKPILSQAYARRSQENQWVAAPRSSRFKSTRNSNARICLAATLALLLTMLGLTSQALAHARWFVKPEDAISVTYSWDFYYALIIGGAILYAILLMAAEDIAARRHIDFVHQPISRSRRLFGWRVLISLTGLTLILHSLSDIFLAPNLRISEPNFFAFLIFAQVVIGGTLLLQNRIFYAAAVIFILPFVCFLIWPFNIIIDYFFEFAGVGLALMMIAPVLSGNDQNLLNALRRLIPTSVKLQFDQDEHSRQSSMRARSFADWLFPLDHIEQEVRAWTVLRIALGLQLATLAIHNKLLNPGISLAFVENNDFINFMPALGVNEFTNLHFVFSAGIAELVFGLLLIGNVASRINSLIILIAFTIPGFLFGVEELLGHLPIMVVLALLVAYGQGERLTSQVGQATERKTSPSTDTAELGGERA